MLINNSLCTGYYTQTGAIITGPHYYNYCYDEDDLPYGLGFYYSGIYNGHNRDFCMDDFGDVFETDFVKDIELDGIEET